jgi:hypothetical protein
MGRFVLFLTAQRSLLKKHIACLALPIQLAAVAGNPKFHALAMAPRPLRMSDNGSEFIGTDSISVWMEHGIDHPFPLREWDD